MSLGKWEGKQMLGRAEKVTKFQIIAARISDDIYFFFGSRTKQGITNIKKWLNSFQKKIYIVLEGGILG